MEKVPGWVKAVLTQRPQLQSCWDMLHTQESSFPNPARTTDPIYSAIQNAVQETDGKVPSKLPPLHCHPFKGTRGLCFLMGFF